MADFYCSREWQERTGGTQEMEIEGQRNLTMTITWQVEHAREPSQAPVRRKIDDVSGRMREK